MALGVDQLYRVTRALVRGPPVSTSGPRRLRPRSEDARATSSPGQLGVVSNVPWDRPAVPGDSGPGRTYRGFDQASRATPAHLRVPRGRPAVPGHSCLCPRARGDVQLSRVNVARIRIHSGLTSCPGRLRPVPEGLWCRPRLSGQSVLVRVPAVSTSSSGRFRPWSEGPRGRPVFPRTSGPGPSARCVEQLPRET